MLSTRHTTYVVYVPMSIVQMLWPATFFLFTSAQDAIEAALVEGLEQPASAPPRIHSLSVASLLPPLTLVGKHFDRVVRAADPTSEEWVVFFCVSWLDECQDLRDGFRRQSGILNAKLNGHDAAFLPRVRFAEVDCAEDKVLCNREQVETYPTILRLVRGERAQAWESNLGRSQQLLQKELAEWMRTHPGSAEPRLRSQAQEHPEETSVDSVRAAVDSAVTVVLLVAFVRMCLDITRSARRALQAPTENAENENAKEQAKSPHATGAYQGSAASTPYCRMARRLPQDWVQQRDEIVL